MLDDITKRRINTLRDILVGKLPDPKAQVEQITNGLIYKFMSDMDEESVSMNGKATFFSQKYKKYSWKNLMDTKTSGVEKVEIYSEAIEQMYNNENLPEIFREIFKNSFLPFKDPSTFNMFLKEINEFNYSHSEKLGDAYEYLLSFMGSQGEAGQFRTPRHIIDFIVELISPQKNEKILDPACGTAGFLISSYKHILKQNTKENIGDLLNASDRKKIDENLNGYDISPDMVKISLVNMYLHRFSNPKIHEYDTLSSEDKWNEYYDVILANPPFFSPKGGITPHNRFGIKSKKAEVLFVDYINEHLKPNGRSGIIVPEGIIFQISKSYSETRKKLIQKGLIGIISLPKGVFNPYSPVKTSILIIDNGISKERDSIFFVKIKNDGFTLNKNRSPIPNSDLPLAVKKIIDFKKFENVKDLHLIKKETLLSQKRISFDTNRYLPLYTNSQYQVVELSKVVDILDSRRKVIKETDRVPGPYPYYGATGIIDYVDDYIFEEKLVLLGEDGADWNYGAEKAFLVDGKCWVNNHAHVMRTKKKYILDEFLIYLLNSRNLNQYITGVIVPKLIQENLKSIRLPLPKIEEQKEILNQLRPLEENIQEYEKKIKNNKEASYKKIDKIWGSK